MQARSGAVVGHPDSADPVQTSQLSQLHLMDGKITKYVLRIPII